MKDFYKDVKINNNSCNVAAKYNHKGHVMKLGYDFVNEIKDYYSDKLKKVNL